MCSDVETWESRAKPDPASCLEPPPCRSDYSSRACALEHTSIITINHCFTARRHAVKFANMAKKRKSETPAVASRARIHVSGRRRARNGRVDLHAIDASSPRWAGGAGLHRSTPSRGVLIYQFKVQLITHRRRARSSARAAASLIAARPSQAWPPRRGPTTSPSSR